MRRGGRYLPSVQQVHHNHPSPGSTLLRNDCGNASSHDPAVWSRGLSITPLSILQLIPTHLRMDFVPPVFVDIPFR